MDFNKEIIQVLKRIAVSVENIANKNLDDEVIITDAKCYIWSDEISNLIPINDVNSIDIELLHGIDGIKDILIENTKNFALGFPANNALLWGARGMGKSSVIKAVHSFLYDNNSEKKLILIEVYREDINSLNKLISKIKNLNHQFIIFCDDLSFDQHESSYKSLKTLLEGGLMIRPKNVVFYATSNRRHLMERSITENEKNEIYQSESTEEKVSLSDRFGLWLGFYQCSQQDYLKIVNSYSQKYKIDIKKNDLDKLAIEWSVTRGSRSGRVAWQFITDLAGKLGKNIN